MRSAVAAVCLLTAAVLTATAQPSWWSECEGMPGGPSGRVPADGAWAEGVVKDGRTLILAGKGNGVGDFYAYDPAEDDWHELASIPRGREDTLPFAGTKGTWDGGNYVYMVKASYSFGFWRYDIESNDWEQLPDVPLGMRRKSVRRGADLAYVDGSVYLLRGYKNEFLRYDVDDTSWVGLPDAPVGVRDKWSGGSWLVHNGAGNLYAHKAKYHELYRFDTDSSAWSRLLPGMPFIGGRSEDGCCAVWFGGSVYALRGSRTREFWKFLSGGDTWVELESLTGVGVGQGGAIALGDTTSEGGRYLYALKAGGNNEFWRYWVPTGLCEPEARPVRSAFPQPSVALGTHLILGEQVAVLVDIRGRKVMDLSPGPNDIRHVAPGVYFVKEEGPRGPGSEGSSVRKVVIQR